MRLRHPFEWLSDSAQQRAFVPLLVLTLVVMMGLHGLGEPLKTEVAPRGILSLQFAGELAVAQRMVESWGPKDQVYAGLNLGLDYLFLVLYASAISLGCVLVGRSLSGRAGSLWPAAIVLAWAQYGAALFDCVENYALIHVLLGAERAMWPAVARWCAVPKFLIVGAGLMYLLVGAILVVMVRVRKKREDAA